MPPGTYAVFVRDSDCFCGFSAGVVVKSGTNTPAAVALAAGATLMIQNTSTSETIKFDVLVAGYRIESGDVAPDCTEWLCVPAASAEVCLGTTEGPRSTVPVSFRAGTLERLTWPLPMQIK